jgi:hypothetical protein
LKKLIAATLLTIYLFTIGGQLVLHQYFVCLSDKFFNEQTDKGQYNVDDLTEVKIPVNMPGITDWKRYEKIVGQVQFENVSYNYIKMKITRNAIYLMCVPNYPTTHLCSQNIIVAKQVKQDPLQQKNHVPYGKIMLLNKFNIAFLQFKFIPPFKGITETLVEPIQQSLHNHSPDIPEQPPRLSC